MIKSDKLFSYEERHTDDELLEAIKGESPAIEHMLKRLGAAVISHMKRIGALETEIVKMKTTRDVKDF